MGLLRRVLERPPRTRVLGSGAVFAVALVASATGQAWHVRGLAALGFVLFPWGGGFLLHWAGDAFLERGRVVAYEEFNRSPVWLFLAFVGWSFAYVYAHPFPPVLVLYEVLVVGTALAAVLGLVAVRTWTSLDVGPSGTLPSKRGMVARSLPLVALFVWLYASGQWTWVTTVALGLVGLVWVVAVTRPEWIPGVSRDASEP